MTENGVWRTMPNGVRVFIENETDIKDAFKSKSRNLESTAQTFRKALNQRSFKTELEHDEKGKLTTVNVMDKNYNHLGVLYFHNEKGYFKTSLELTNKNRRIVQQILDITDEVGNSHGYNIDYPDDFY